MLEIVALLMGALGVVLIGIGLAMIRRDRIRQAEQAQIQNNLDRIPH